jgi:glycosyltransferase involved in cell wall biosynthesis
VNQISGVLITHNEEEKIETAIRSLQGICEEILVVDSFSKDRTPAICEDLGVLLLQREWKGYVHQKQFAVDSASNEWILSLDADEKLSPELRKEILEWKKTPSQHDGYVIPRLTYFLGRFIYHTCWYPDYQMRLFRRSKGQWRGRRVHESVVVEGSKGKMKNSILHFTYASVSEYLAQLERFSSLVAADYFDQGRRASIGRLLFYPHVVFIKNYFLKKGFLDGIPGAVVSYLAAASTFFNYLKLWELQRGLKSHSKDWDHLDPKSPGK